LLAAEAMLATRDFDVTNEMSTGRLMHVRFAGDAVRMRYGRQRQVALQHDGKGSFVSADGRVSLVFALDHSGDLHAVRLAMPSGWL
jgi:hypothetical protein